MSQPAISSTLSDPYIKRLSTHVMMWSRGPIRNTQAAKTMRMGGVAALSNSRLSHFCRRMGNGRLHTNYQRAIRYSSNGNWSFAKPTWFRGACCTCRLSVLSSSTHHRHAMVQNTILMRNEQNGLVLQKTERLLIKETTADNKPSCLPSLLWQYRKGTYHFVWKAHS